MKMHGSRKHRAHFWTGNATCKFSNCAEFEFYIKKEPVNSSSNVTIHVIVSGNVRHEKGEHARQLTGNRRAELGEEVTRDGPAETYHKLIGDMNEQSFKAGNMTFCQKPNVLKKAGYDYRKSLDLHQNNLLEILFAKEDFEIEDDTSTNIKGYIQEVHADPFTVIMYSEAQFACHLPKDPLHLDATGSVCRKVEGQDKQILYYALVKPGNKATHEPPIPIAECLTVDQSVASITHFLQVVKRDYKKCTGKVLEPIKVEVDFSWTLLHSVMLTFNQCDMVTYLQRSWLNKMTKLTTVVHLCSAHFIKMIMNKMKHIKDVNLKLFVGYCIGFMQNSKSLLHFREIFTSMTHIFNSKYKNKIVTEIVKKMEKMIELWTQRRLKWIPMSLQMSIPSSTNNPHSIYIFKSKMSKFCHLFNKMITNQHVIKYPMNTTAQK